jgi:hypothetical protein
MPEPAVLEEIVVQPILDFEDDEDDGQEDGDQENDDQEYEEEDSLPMDSNSYPTPPISPVAALLTIPTQQGATQQASISQYTFEPWMAAFSVGRLV